MRKLIPPLTAVAVWLQFSQDYAITLIALVIIFGMIISVVLVVLAVDRDKTIKQLLKTVNKLIKQLGDSPSNQQK